MKQIWVILCAAAGFLIGWNSAKSQDSARFDHLVRNDLFAGLMGDQGALDRAMAKTESVLASNPDHAEALVWHGAGLLRRSGLHFEKGDFHAGQDLWAKGISEMNRAVELEPDNVGVRIPRGATYLAVSRFVPPEMGKPLLETGLSDYATLPWFLRSLTMSMAFSNCIGTLAFFTMPHVGSAFATKRFPLNWLILLGALGLIGVAGTLLALVILTYAGLFTPSVFWQIFRIAIRTTLLIAFVVGIAVTLYEVQRYRLASATLALRTRELERERALKLAAEARLASLESRIHPHFLFNTINSISALIREDPGRAERMLERMAALLRFSLDSQHRPLAQVAVELKIARDYLEVERARFGDRLRYSISAEPEAERCLLPALAVQTLVENSVKYAVSPRRSGATIRVSARRCGEALEVEVWDDGPGFTREAAADGHGIETLESRLAALFGGQALLAIESKEQGTAVRLRLPAREEPADG
ncbi:MAG: histidine kinase [Bryobacteraceae bacterium]